MRTLQDLHFVIGEIGGGRVHPETNRGITYSCSAVSTGSGIIPAVSVAADKSTSWSRQQRGPARRTVARTTWSRRIVARLAWSKKSIAMTVRVAHQTITVRVGCKIS